ncbi:MAG: M28 family peptidase [Bacteroidales bacterium]|jgi:aminopeptidase YwaD|nr:M28 family peptidase [Bacteroidales bacterium]
MDKRELTAKIESHLQVLCSEIGERRVGSERNRQATTYAEKVLEAAGWSVEQTRLQVMDWRSEGATLTCGGETFEVFSSHYSQGCDVCGKLVAVDSIIRLEQTDITDRIVLLHGEIAAGQIAPKNFPFWNPEEHQHIVALLERGNPLALVCATGRNAASAGGVYPFPLFEDGDFDIPSVYMKDTEGERLLACAGQAVELISRTERIRETAFNIIGRNSSRAEGRTVVSAHIDTKIGTPGAIDNGTGVAAVLVLAELLKECKHPVELVIFNGEDYYGAPGQLKYIEQNAGRFGDIMFNINIDGAGYKEGLSCFSPFDLPENIAATLRDTLCNNPNIVEGLPWYQGDHSLFLQQGRPAIAVSSQWFIENMDTQQLTHTPKDNLSVVDCMRIAECAAGIAELTERLFQH